MRTNLKTKQPQEFTAESGKAVRLTNEQALRRSVMSCFLWEKEFYEDGQFIADRISKLAQAVPAKVLAALAIEARQKMHLRHVPLLLLTELAQTGSGTSILSQTIPQVVQRADELAELVALYWRGGKKPLSAQLKKGLASAFANFNEYELAKYNRDSAVKLRDVMFMVHPKAPSIDMEEMYKRLAENELATPDTWEVALSSGADKKETFTRLLTEKKLGYLALLRNLRNMVESKVDLELVRDALLTHKGQDRVLPFRYVAAARAAPQLEPTLDKALIARVNQMNKLPGKTIVLVDVSGSMDSKLSAKSDLTCMDAAATLASVLPSDDLRVFSFSENVKEVPPRRGMAGIDAIIKSQMHGGTYLAQAIRGLQGEDYDRLIVITDEQSHDDPTTVKLSKDRKHYMINVASNKNGVGYKPHWVHIDGFSENVINFIQEYEGAK